MDKYITFLCSNDNGLTWFAWYKLTNTIWSVYEPEARHLTTEQLENNEPGYTRCIPIPYDTSNSIKFNDNPVPLLGEDVIPTLNNPEVYKIYLDLKKIFEEETVNTGMFDAASSGRFKINTNKGILTIELGDLEDHYKISLQTV